MFRAHLNCCCCAVGTAQYIGSFFVFTYLIFVTSSRSIRFGRTICYTKICYGQKSFFLKGEWTNERRNSASTSLDQNLR